MVLKKGPKYYTVLESLLTGEKIWRGKIFFCNFVKHSKILFNKQRNKFFAIWDRNKTVKFVIPPIAIYLVIIIAAFQTMEI
jgi:hypothetical protein